MKTAEKNRFFAIKAKNILARSAAQAGPSPFLKRKVLASLGRSWASSEKEMSPGSNIFDLKSATNKRD
jgi:hypothetical protein